MIRQILFLSFILALFSGVLNATIINVPDDEETIQAGIDAADRGDTVLVAAGEYVERIGFENKAITIIGNPDNPSEVIIDGDENGTVVMIYNVREGICTIEGFTIQNANANNDGGGMYLNNSNIRLRNLIVEGNRCRDSGGGIYMRGCDNAELIDVNIVNNLSMHDAGGIMVQGSEDVIMQNVLIDGNIGGSRGGGIYGLGAPNLIVSHSVIINNSTEISGGGVCVDNTCTLQNVLLEGNSSETDGGCLSGHNGSFNLINCTIVGNSAPVGSFFSNRASNDLIMTNCIIWNVEENPIQTPFQEITVNFSNIENGEDLFNGVNEEIFNWGEGNINEDPRFVDAENGDYHLENDSPCIDTGDPDGELDPDGTRADIGAYPFIQGGEIDGYVLDFSNDQPLEGAVVSASYGVESITDDEGYWQISPIRLAPFDLTVRMIGYLDSTQFDLQLENEDTLSITFRLLHAELEPSLEAIASELEIGNMEQFDFNISNPGNGLLEWSVETRYRGDAAYDPWELRQSYQFGEQLDDSRLYGVVYLDSLFYVAGGNERNPTIYIINMEGELVDTFAQPGDDGRGIKDFAWDGELLWGAVDDTVYGMTLDGDIVISFEAPNRITCIAWDSDREVLWGCNTVSDPIGMNRDGNLVEGMEIDVDRLRIYSLAYFADDPDNSPLYIYHREEGTNRQSLTKYNIETGELIFVTYLGPEDGGTPQGAFITNELDPFNWVFISVANDAVRDRVDIWQLEAITSWSIVEPARGTINPAEVQDINLIIETADLMDWGELNYPAELVFSHNGFGLETVIPIDLTVSPLGVDNFEKFIPNEFVITKVYPNPFNSTVRLSYAIPEVSIVSLKLYDITGSLVETVADGTHQSGQHAVMWNASGLPSGIYFARLEAGGFSQTVKLMLMK